MPAAGACRARRTETLVLGVLGGGEMAGHKAPVRLGCASMARPSVCSVMDVRPT